MSARWAHSYNCVKFKVPVFHAEEVNEGIIYRNYSECYLCAANEMAYEQEGMIAIYSGPEDQHQYS